MNARQMTRAYFDARIARLNNITGLHYGYESGSAYTSYKIVQNQGSRTVVYAKTKRELDTAISGMLELAYAIKGIK